MHSPIPTPKALFSKLYLWPKDLPFEFKQLYKETIIGPSQEVGLIRYRSALNPTAHEDQNARQLLRCGARHFQGAGSAEVHLGIKTIRNVFFWGRGPLNNKDPPQKKNSIDNFFGPPYLYYAPKPKTLNP